MRFVPARLPAFERTLPFYQPTRYGYGIALPWLRLGFVVPWHAPVEVRAAPVYRRGCAAQRAGQACAHHEEDEIVQVSAHRNLQLRYPLYGREIDAPRSQWEYYAHDVQNDVRIPVGVARNQFQLQNGDIVQLLGDDQAWAVVLTEI